MTRASPQEEQAGPGRPPFRWKNGVSSTAAVVIMHLLGEGGTCGRLSTQHPQLLCRFHLLVCSLVHSTNINASITGEGTEALRLEPNTSDEHQGEGEGQVNGD